MTSKIINMVDRLKDKEDLALEAMFRSGPVDDDGFSARVVTRVRRRVWVRRLSMPIAILIGSAFAVGPIMEVLSVLPGLATSVFGASFSIDQLPFGELPQVSTILFGGSLVMAMLLASRVLEE